MRYKYLGGGVFAKYSKTGKYLIIRLALRQFSNLHALHHWKLNTTCLAIPPQALYYLKLIRYFAFIISSNDKIVTTL